GAIGACRQGSSSASRCGREQDASGQRDQTARGLEVDGQVGGTGPSHPLRPGRGQRRATNATEQTQHGAFAGAFKAQPRPRGTEGELDAPLLAATQALDAQHAGGVEKAKKDHGQRAGEQQRNVIPLSGFPRSSQGLKLCTPGPARALEGRPNGGRKPAANLGWISSRRKPGNNAHTSSWPEGLVLEACGGSDGHENLGAANMGKRQIGRASCRER